jgi:hypothetical protein
MANREQDAVVKSFGEEGYCVPCVPSVPGHVKETNGAESKRHLRNFRGHLDQVWFVAVAFDWRSLEGGIPGTLTARESHLGRKVQRDAVHGWDHEDADIELLKRTQDTAFATEEALLLQHLFLFVAFNVDSFSLRPQELSDVPVRVLLRWTYLCEFDDVFGPRRCCWGLSSVSSGSAQYPA